MNIVLPKYCAPFLFKWPVYLDDITDNKNRMENYGLADYFGVNSVMVESHSCR